MFIWPIEAPVSRGFAYRSTIYFGGQHAAVDIPAIAGTPIKAVAAGKVAERGFDHLSGYHLGIDHDDGWQSHYRHLNAAPPLAHGGLVTQGQEIGNVGSTGLSTGPHLHFDLWNAQKRDATAFAKHGIWAHDPELYLGQLGQEDDMPDPIFKTPSNRRAQVGAAGKSVIGMDEHVNALVSAGAKIIDVSEALFDAIPAVVTPALLDGLAAGGGISFDQAVTAAKKAAKEGSG